MELKFVVTTLVFWALVFGVLVLPARPVGRWLVRDGSKGPMLMFIHVLCCVKLAWLVVLIGLFVLMMWSPDSFPHVKDDPMGFGMLFSAALLFVPAFLALLMGYLRARKIAEAQ